MKKDRLRAIDMCHMRLVTADEGESIASIANIMREHGIGDVVVTSRKDGNDVPVGIVTDRDIVVHALALEVSLDEIKAGDLTHRSLVTVNDDDDLYEIAREMNVNAVRRLIVIDGPKIVGIVTLDDVLLALNEVTSHISASVGRQVREEKDTYSAKSVA